MWSFTFCFSVSSWFTVTCIFFYIFWLRRLINAPIPKTSIFAFADEKDPCEGVIHGIGQTPIRKVWVNCSVNSFILCWTPFTVWQYTLQDQNLLNYDPSAALEKSPTRQPPFKNRHNYCCKRSIDRGSGATDRLIFLREICCWRLRQMKSVRRRSSFRQILKLAAWGEPAPLFFWPLRFDQPIQS